MNTAIRDQVFNSLAGSFLQMLFSSDGQADAQKQQMMAELEKRKAEALRLNQIEEAKRLEAICNRLEASLKLYGVPDLKPKNDASASGDLQLKLGDGGSSRHGGIRGLPGIALNDTTGNGGTTPYGIPGLPGIYTNGPSSGSTAPIPADPALSLKTGDGSSAPSASAPSPGSSPSQPASADANPAADSASSAIDPRNMTPPQMADMATKIASLPPAEQQRLMDAAANTAKGAPTGVGATGTPQPSASVTSSQPVASQLQKIAGASQAATNAATPEDAAALARTGFDTPGAGAPTTGLATPVALSPSSGTPQVQLSATASPVSAGQRGASTAARLAIHSIPPTLPPGIALAPSGVRTQPATGPDTGNSVAASGDCPPGVEKLVPSRRQLETELAVRRAQLESLQNTITRFNRTIQLDQQQYAVWEDEASAAIDRLKGRIWDTATTFAFDNLIDSEKEHIKEMPISDAERADKLRRLKLAENIKDFDDFQHWALDNKDDWEMINGGIRSMVDSLPLAEEPLYYVHCAEDLIDNAYDLTDYIATWNNVQQLGHNSDQFLQAVRLNGQRMTALVQRIQTIQAQLKATPEGPQGTPVCHSAKAGMK